MTFSPLQIGSGAVAATLAIAAGLRTMLRRWRQSTINTIFIHDMATNHLPHIYTALEIIGLHLGVDVGKSPRIKFLDRKDFEG